MQIKENNYAFIDSQNLNLSIQDILEYKKVTPGLTGVTRVGGST